MPNQLSKTNRRQSLAEHEAVLAALAEIARSENTTVMAVLRDAARSLVKRKAKDPALAARLLKSVLEKSPKMPARFKSAAQVSRFKRAQREFDQVLLDLALADPESIQRHNSIATSRRALRMIDFDQSHASVAI